MYIESIIADLKGQSEPLPVSPEAEEEVKG
jgi:hypothetical protein